MVNYNKIAESYDKRYKNESIDAIVLELNRIISENGYTNISEIGCGTGQWLKNLNKSNNLFGIDSSLGMIKKAKFKLKNGNFICGDADKLPLKKSLFDMIYCINALHHFSDQNKFIAESISILKPNGTFAIIGVFPDEAEYHWYVYDYFPGVLERDLERFPTEKKIVDQFLNNNLIDITITKICSIKKTYIGNEVFSDPFLSKKGCSQMLILSEDEYQNGINSIKSKISTGIELKRPAIFSTNINYKIIFGRTKL